MGAPALRERHHNFRHFSGLAGLGLGQKTDDRLSEVGSRNSEVGPVVVPKEWDFRLRQATPRLYAAASMRESEKGREKLECLKKTQIHLTASQSLSFDPIPFTKHLAP